MPNYTQIRTTFQGFLTQIRTTFQAFLTQIRTIFWSKLTQIWTTFQVFLTQRLVCHYNVIKLIKMGVHQACQIFSRIVY